MKLWSRLGPGLITGIADDDPSAITTFTLIGASFGYRLLWAWMFTLPVGIAVQLICARLGASGSGLTTLFVQRWGRARIAPVIALLAASCVLSIGADIAAIAAVCNLLLHIPSIIAFPVLAALLLAIEIRSSYRRFVHVLRWGALVTLAYIGGAFAAHADIPSALAAAAVPHLTLDHDTLGALLALAGALLSPYIYFWQANEESEERTSRGVGIRDTEDRRHAQHFDVVLGMTVANMIFIFVVLTAAAALPSNGVTTVSTIRDAAEALRPLAGPAAYALFSVGIVISGLIAVPVLAGTAAYAIAEIAGWRRGLDESFGHARAFYLVIMAATAFGIGLNVFGVEPVQMLYTAAVVNGLLAPVVLTLLMLIASDRDMVGIEHPGMVTRVLGWGAAGTTALGAVFFLATAA